MPGVGFGWSASSFQSWCRIGVNSGLRLGECPRDLSPETFFGGGDPDFDVVQAQAEFEVNAIPTCVCLLALGRRTDDTVVASKIHTNINKMGMMLPFELWMSASSISGDPRAEQWPEEPFLVFRGYAIACGLRKGQQGVEFTISAAHWLVDLNFSSSLSRTTHPLNPAQLSYLATVLHGVDAGSFDRHFTPSTLGHQFFSAETLASDFWADSRIFPTGVEKKLGIKGWLEELCGQNRLQFAPAANRPLPVPTPEKNAEALCALQKFEPLATEGGYEYGTPISLSFANDAAGIVANNISTDISAITLGTMAGTTVWDKLIEICSQYLLNVVPMVDRALVVPFTPGYNGGYWRTIYTTTFDRVEWLSPMIRPIRGVCFFTGRAVSLAGGDGNTAITGMGGVPTDYAAGACFDALGGGDDSILKRGTVLFKETPRWLQGVIAFPNKPPPKIGMASSLFTTLDGDVLEKLVMFDMTSPADGAAAMKPLLNSYAQLLYLSEVLRGKQMLILGKLRFDIAPGSHVRVEGAEDPFLAGTINGNRLDEVLFGTVMKVSYIINSETGVAGTTFNVSYVRNCLENKTASTSIAVNPLWTGEQANAWAGAPLVTALPIGFPEDPGDPSERPDIPSCV